MPLCEYLILDDNISKIHAKILFKNGNVYIFDNSQRLGTFIEHNSNKLAIGNKYLIGRYVFGIGSNNVKSVENFLKRASF